MTTASDHQAGGHAFISYVREDRPSVDKLQRILDSAGIPVWRDTDSLWPGEDWKLKIRRAISSESLVFFACFSKNSNSRQSTYQNEELILAIEEMRKRPPGGTPWLIPIRFDDCEIPEYEIGAGRMLSSLQAVSLFGENQELSTSRLVASVMRILATAAPGMPVTAKMGDSSETVTQVKRILLDNSRRIELHDLVTGITNDCRSALNDREIFPSSTGGSNREIVEFSLKQTAKYRQTLRPVTELLAAGCAWGEQHHEKLWTTTARAIANTAKPDSGLSVLINLRKLPTVAMLYAAGLAALYSQNYGSLRAVAIDTRVHTYYKGDIPLIGASHVWRPFENNAISAQMLARHVTDPDQKEGTDDELYEGLTSGRIGKRHTPVSDYFHDAMRDDFRFLLPNDSDYTEIFDQLEVFLAALAIDTRDHLEKTDKTFTDGPWFGSFTWRNRHATPTLEALLKAELDDSGSRWLPLQAGLFGGSLERASAAMSKLVDEAAAARQNRW